MSGIVVSISFESPPIANVCARTAVESCRVGAWAASQRDAIVAALDDAIAAAGHDCEAHEHGCASVPRLEHAA